MANKEVNGGQCTVLWHVDNLKWSNLTDDVLADKINIMNKVFGSEDAPLNICRGKIHDYFDMNLDYSLHDKVKCTMLDYIEGFLRNIPYSLKGYIVNVVPNHLLEVGEDTPMLQHTDSKIYYHRAIQLLWLAKRIYPDLLPPLSYLTTSVQSPNIHDW